MMYNKIFMIRNSTGNPELFSFDFWNTIVAPNAEFSSRRNTLVYEQLGSPVELQEFTRRFGAVKTQTERRSEVEGRHIGLAERLGVLCLDLQLPQLSSKTIADIRDGQHMLSESYPAPLFSSEVPLLLHDINTAGKTVGIISNTGLLDGHDVTRIMQYHGLDELVSHWVFSDQTGVAKPNARAFYALTDLANVRPEQTLHTGDNYAADYEGALAANMRAVHASLDLQGIAKVREFL